MTYNDEMEINSEKCWELRLLGFKTNIIAQQIGVSRETVARMIRKKLKEQVKELSKHDDKLAMISANLDKVEEESWRKFKTDGSVKWLDTVIRVQDKKLLILGIGKQTLNMTQNNLSIDNKITAVRVIHERAETDATMVSGPILTIKGKVQNSSSRETER
jgi:hypothetical protein